MTVVRWLTALLAATVALTFALPAVAKVVRLEISRTDPYGSFLAGDYVRMEGRVFGELAADEKIPGIDKATRNTRGKVEYSTPITIIMPKDAGDGNGALLFDVANRGRGPQAFNHKTI